MSINCGHCEATHDTVAEVRACAEEHPYHPEPVRTTPLHCGRKMAPIVYGYPSGEMHEAAAKGEIRLGGCMVGAFDASWYCPICGHYAFDPELHHVGGLGHVRMSTGGVGASKVADQPWWTKARSRVHRWLGRGV